MIGYPNLILRLVIWFLLTADWSVTNISIGVCVALLLPRSYTTLSASKDWLRLLWETLTVIPRAYREAIEMMIRPHTREDVVKRRIKPERTPGLIFLDIFLITLTPKTLVMKYHEEGWYEVHRVRRKMKP